MLGVFRREKDSLRAIEMTSDAAYLATQKGVFRFDPRQNKLNQIAGTGSAIFLGQLSSGGNKLAILEFKLIKIGKTITDAPVLLVMNKDGSGKKSLLEDYLKKDGSFLEHIFLSSLISPDGEKIAIVTKDRKKERKDKNSAIWTIWSLNSDGTGLRGQPLGLPGVDWLDLVGWEMSGRSMIVWALTKRGTAKSNNKLLNFDLQTGSFEVLADDLRKPFQTWISPGRDFLIYSFHDEKAAQEVLAKLDLRNLQREEIYRGSSIEMFRLNKDGDKIAFLAEKGKLGLYLFSEKRIIALVEYKPGKAPSRVHSLEWVSAGEELVLGDNLENGSCLRVFGMDLAEKKAIKIPFSLEYVQLTALNEFVFVWNYRTSELWTVNIDTEKCQRVI
jgi:hypothetical protein